MFLALVGTKGGVGKTTPAVHLAAALAELAPTVLLDGDQNRSATTWALQSADGLPYPVQPIGTPPPAGVAHVVVDTAANEADDDLRALAAQADAVVIPTRPAALDLIGAAGTAQLLEGAGAPVAVLLTMCPPRPQRDALEAREYLTGRGVRVLSTEIPARKGYQAAALEGRVVRDSNDRAAADLWAVWPDALFEVMP